MLNELAGIEVVGDVGDGAQAVEAAGRLRPDVAVLDVIMPALDGFTAARRISASWPEVRVLILSMHEGPDYVSEAACSGALGYIDKGASIEELEQAVRTVAAGNRFTKRVLGYAPARHEDLGRLTRRQTEILGLIANGCSTKEIANGLKISVKTVESHRAQLMDRLDIYEVAGLVKFAVRTGLVGRDP